MSIEDWDAMREIRKERDALRAEVERLRGLLHDCTCAVSYEANNWYEVQIPKCVMDEARAARAPTVQPTGVKHE
jgi:hypothetical protein